MEANIGSRALPEIVEASGTEPVVMEAKMTVRSFQRGWRQVAPVVFLEAAAGLRNTILQLVDLPYLWIQSPSFCHQLDSRSKSPKHRWSGSSILQRIVAKLWATPLPLCFLSAGNHCLDPFGVWTRGMTWRFSTCKLQT